MTVLDAGTERFLEPDWVFEVEAVHVGSSEPPVSRRIVAFARCASGAEVWVHVNLVGAPALVEVILGTGPVGATRPRFAIDHKHVVALAVPNWGVALDVIVYTDKVPSPSRLAEDIVVLIRRVVLEFSEGLPLEIGRAHV